MSSDVPRATPKQVAFIRHLVEQKGVESRHVRWVGSWSKRWLTQRERGGQLEYLDRVAASKLIDGLLALPDVEDDDEADGAD